MKANCIFSINYIILVFLNLKIKRELLYNIYLKKSLLYNINILDNSATKIKECIINFKIKEHRRN